MMLLLLLLLLLLWGLIARLAGCGGGGWSRGGHSTDHWPGRLLVLVVHLCGCGLLHLLWLLLWLRLSLLVGGSHGGGRLTHVAVLHVDGLQVSGGVEPLARCEYCRVSRVTHGHVLLLVGTVCLVDHLDWLLGRIMDHLRVGVTRLEGRRSRSIGQWIGDRRARSDGKLLTSLQWMILYPHISAKLSEVQVSHLLLLALVRHPCKIFSFYKKY